MGSPQNGLREHGRMTLIEAAMFMERLQGRAAHARELEAMQIARDALLTIVSEGYVTLRERLRRERAAAGGQGGAQEGGVDAPDAPDDPTRPDAA
jgi:hypothetical protein